MDPGLDHHLALQKVYVKMFKLLVSPGDSVVLNQSDQDGAAIAIDEQPVAASLPGKPGAMAFPQARYDVGEMGPT
jgi:hypothetical protein